MRDNKRIIIGMLLLAFFVTLGSAVYSASGQQIIKARSFEIFNRIIESRDSYSMSYTTAFIPNSLLFKLETLFLIAIFIIFLNFFEIAKSFRYTLLTGALSYILIYLIVVFFRIKYPFEIECLEGVALEHVHRILTGQKIYVSPSLQFVSVFYPPLYYYLAAIISKVAGLSLITLRSISFIASLGSIYLIFLFVKKETKDNFSGILASSLFAATFQLSGRWLDVGRIDTLFLFFLLVSLYLIKFKQTLTSYVLAGIVMSLSFLTKQPALAVILFIMPYCILVNRRLFIAFAGTIALIIGVSTVLLNYFSNGWYVFYVFWLPTQYQYNESRMYHFWQWYLFSPLPVASLMSIWYLFSQRLNSDKKNFLFYLLTGIAAMIIAFSTLIKTGGYYNALLPLYAVMAILFGLGAHKVFEYARYLPFGKQKIAEICIYLLCIMQFANLVYNPLDAIPHRKDLELNIKYVNTIRQIKGAVFIPQSNYLSFAAGKKRYADWAGIASIVWARNKQVSGKLSDEIRQAVREKRFGALMLDSAWEAYFITKLALSEIEQYYIKQDSLPACRFIFERPEVRRLDIYIPKETKTD